MRVRAYLPLTLHITAWTVLCGVFFFLSVPIVYRAVLENRISPIQANQSIDAYLQALTGIRNGSQRLSDTFQCLPQRKPLVILVREQNAQSEFLGMLTAYLSWPREVQIVNVRSANAEKEVGAISPPSVAGLVFCSMNPPVWLGKGIRLGSNILLVPAPDVKP